MTSFIRATRRQIDSGVMQAKSPEFFFPLFFSHAPPTPSMQFLHRRPFAAVRFKKEFFDFALNDDRVRTLILIV